MKDDRNPAPARAGWRVRSWAAGADVSQALVRKMLAAGELPSVLIGSARVISISPAAYLQQCAERERRK